MFKKIFVILTIICVFSGCSIQSDKLTEDKTFISEADTMVKSDCSGYTVSVEDLKEKAKFIMAKIREYFEDKVCDFSYEIVDEESKEYDFVIDFTVYNFYAVTIFYYNGKYEFSIVYNNQKIKILDLQEECDDIVLQKLQDELKLRIPDKYLMANGWM